MSGDRNSNIQIPSVFLQQPGAELLRTLLSKEEKVQVLLTWIPKYPDEETTESGDEETTESGDKKEEVAKEEKETEEPGDPGQRDSRLLGGQDGEECTGEHGGSEQDTRQYDGGQEQSCGGGGSSSLFDDGQSDEEHEKT